MLALAGQLAGCGVGRPAPSAPPSIPPIIGGSATATPLASADWPTYHHDNARTGVAAGLAPLGTLSLAWHTKLDGAVYGQPLVIGGEVLAATEGDTVYALDSTTGRVLWSVRLGTPVPLSSLPCGDIDPLGITGTMAYDADTSRVFAVAETTAGTHVLTGIDVNTGTVAVRVEVEPPRGDRIAHQQRAALTVLNGRVYMAYGGLFGDCGNYVGTVVSVTTNGTDPLTYLIPTSREGGIWSPGGAVVDHDRLLYAVGNGESRTTYDGSDAVLALSGELRLLDFFAPSTWADDNDNDLDLGSASPTLMGPWIFVAGKRGTGYVLRRDRLGGIGGEIARLDMCRSFGGSAVDGTIAYLPCLDGPRSLTIDAAGLPRVGWHATVAAAGSPTVGGGAVWVTDYRHGLLYALDPRTGRVRAQLDVGALPHFASPTLSGTHAYLGTMDGVTAINGA